VRRPYVGGCNSPFNQPVAFSVFSGSGPSHSKHWNVRCRSPPGGSARKAPAVWVSGSFGLSHMISFRLSETRQIQKEPIIIIHRTTPKFCGMFRERNAVSTLRSKSTAKIKLGHKGLKQASNPPKRYWPN
jgi:hypothetical protein